MNAIPLINIAPPRNDNETQLTFLEGIHSKVDNPRWVGSSTLESYNIDTDKSYCY